MFYIKNHSRNGTKSPENKKESVTWFFLNKEIMRIQ